MGLWYLKLFSVYWVFGFEMNPVAEVLGQSQIVFVNADGVLVPE
jgi:hypothetical protein